MDYAVIMAGGTGKRLWPLSRQSRPKQVLKLLDGETLLRRCFDRLTGIFDQRNILVLTNAGYADLVRENLPEIPYGNVIAEPAVRDTAGAIGLAATILSKYDPDASMAVVTADQVIEPDEVFRRAMTSGLAFINANPDAMITFGIQPAFASTQLGYIQIGAAQPCDQCADDVYRVMSFREKPDEKTAVEYIDSGQYCWNSGMFVWKAKTILKNLTEKLPVSAEPLGRIQAAWDSPNQDEILKEWFLKMPKISIDYAVMESATNVCAIKLACRWLDMGSFAALADIIRSDANNNIVVAGHSRLLDSSDNIIATEDEDHLIAVIGLKNMVVAHSKDATLVCPIGETGRLKELLEIIKEQDGEKFL
ncbi:MAG: mannose-1-phosphate guanylyltransferase [Planctomycetota bacterium]|nr:MAG: mannose-1-phosphate guanylyltransferase [Planctomycetota bacterium]